MKIATVLLPVLGLLLLGCSPEAPSVDADSATTSTLGDLQHGFTLNAGTQEKFEEGLLLLHNFEYEDALTAFKAATAADSTEILAHWGEAMCHYKALWRLQNTEKGRAVLSRFGDTKAERMASISDPTEKALWEMVEIMYGEGEFEERNQALVKHLAAQHARYPEHQEIAAFYALSLVWATETYGDGSKDLRLAASIADDILAVNPRHPGALHYKIHALDGPTSAQDAHKAADAYAKVAADAAHALHMPSHIYLALGEWEGVVKSNTVSYQASVNRMERMNLTDGARGYHSYAWLHYGLLQQGRYQEAEALLQDMLAYVPNDPTKSARGYLLGIQSRQLAESGEVSPETVLDTEVKVYDIGLDAKAKRSFLRAQLAFQDGDIGTLREERKWLATQISLAADLLEDDGLELCATGTTRYAPTENAMTNAKAVVAQIKGLIALHEGDEDRFAEHMQEAVALEEQTNFPAGPPTITKPSFEQYGEWLLEQGQYQEALTQFDKALRRMPRRSKSLMGKMIALQKLDRHDEAQSIEEELEGILAQADEGLLSMR